MIRIEMKIYRDPFFEPNINIARFDKQMSVSRIGIVALQEECTAKLLKNCFFLI
jgi:hypothetical protein